MEKTYIDNIQEFANKHGLVFEQEGEIGFGRECVGLLHGDNYIAYNPINSTTYENIKEFYSEKFYDISPEDAYHKGDYVAVLGRGFEALKQLSEWVDEFKKLDATVEDFNTGATGMQAMISGVRGKTIKLGIN